MTLVLYSKTPEDKCTQIQEEVLLEPEDIKINLIIDSKRPLLLQAKRGETIKEILIRNTSKLQIDIKTLIFKYGNKIVDINKNFDEIADARDKNYVVLPY